MFITRNDEKLKFYGAGMRGGNVLQNACQKNGMSLCKKCYIEPVEVRARKAGNCWDAWRECAGMHGRNVLQNVLH